VTDCLIDFDGVRLRLLTAATNGHIFHPPDELESDGGMILTGKPKNSEKNLSQCHFVNHKTCFVKVTYLWQISSL
jgi:hypothetical protein